MRSLEVLLSVYGFPRSPEATLYRATFWRPALVSSRRNTCDFGNGFGHAWLRSRVAERISAEVSEGLLRRPWRPSRCVELVLGKKGGGQAPALRKQSILTGGCQVLATASRLWRPDLTRIGGVSAGKQNPPCQCSGGVRCASPTLRNCRSERVPWCRIAMPI